MTLRLILLTIFALLINSCSVVMIRDSNSTARTSRSFRVVGYMTDAAVLETIPFEKLTHVNYAFIIPNSDGTFQNFPNIMKLQKTVEMAHEKGVKVLISVGGWGWDAQFEELAASFDRRTVFIRELLKFVQENNMDGADIDWEFPDPGQSSRNFLALITELRAALPKNKLLTAAVIATGEADGGIVAESFLSMDFINLMVYDGCPVFHASIEHARTSLDKWMARGLPPEKTVLGVPFYSHPSEIPYRLLVKADPAAAYADFIDYNGIGQNYNGVPTIRAKTKLAMEKASGIMFWNLDYDTLDETSLLSTINRTIQEKPDY